MIKMIGSKIISKIFDDNLKDYENAQNEDLEPIMNICSIISKVLVILKELDVRQRAKIESQVLYKGNILGILFKYISQQYQPNRFNFQKFSEHDKILRTIKQDEEFLNLFTFIVSKLLIVIDDLEFQGKNKTQSQYSFIPFKDIRYVSWILNNIAYRIFWNESTMNAFTEEFRTNLKKALTGLYDRDKRLKINGENFWIIEKDIIERLDDLPYERIQAEVSHTVLINMPHAIPFSLRAKIFQNIVKSQK